MRVMAMGMVRHRRMQKGGINHQWRVGSMSASLPCTGHRHWAIYCLQDIWNYLPFLSFFSLLCLHFKHCSILIFLGEKDAQESLILLKMEFLWICAQLSNLIILTFKSFSSTFRYIAFRHCLSFFIVDKYSWMILAGVAGK